LENKKIKVGNMSFLNDTDYKVYIKDEHLEIITSSSEEIRQKAELAGLEEMQSYLRTRYDIPLIFIDVDEWNELIAYIIDGHVIFNEVVYKSKTGNIDQQPDESPADWEIGDDRNQVVIMYLVDLIIYHLHTSVNPRNIPELRGIRYDAAITWLRAVNVGELEPNLPKLIDEDGNETNLAIESDSKRKQENDW